MRRNGADGRDRGEVAGDPHQGDETVSADGQGGYGEGGSGHGDQYTRPLYGEIW
jgi:hypothetical protein